MIAGKEDDSSLFYPLIKRREKYSTRPDGAYYSDYNHYHGEIAEDCQQRCVYCDIRHNEIGYEGMVLDHFRPQKHFQTLINMPDNLVLSCPKCNRLKSDLWPVGNECSSTHDGMCGFIDPFIEPMSNYFEVLEDGELKTIKPPAPYIEKVLVLNRKSRKQVRLLRIISYKIKKLLNEMESEFTVTLKEWQEKKITNEEFKTFCSEHHRKIVLVRELNENTK
jgi:hypothetical protein